VALPSLFKFFAAWPTPESIINASQLDIAQFLRPLGLQETRAHAIKRMSRKYSTPSWINYRCKCDVSAFGGLVVSMLASGTQDRGFEPG
jgi:hypothetical protein